MEESTENHGVPRVDLDTIADAGSDILYIIGIVLILLVIAVGIYFYRKSK